MTAPTTLRTGWDAGCPDDDTVTRQAVLSLAARVEHLSGAMGGRTRRDADWVLGDQGVATPLANAAIALHPIPSAAAAAEMRSFFANPFLVMSAWPTPDLAPAGFGPVGHPPFMLLPAGATAPPPPPELEITEVTDRATALRFAATLAESYPVHGISPADAGTLVDERMLGSAMRAWVGAVDGRDVTVASAFTHSGVTQVEMVATHPDGRGRGYGAAVTWRAALADPTVPAVLIASDHGRPVYERMGFIPLTRWTLWIGTPS